MRSARLRRFLALPRRRRRLLIEAAARYLGLRLLLRFLSLRRLHAHSAPSAAQGQASTAASAAAAGAAAATAAAAESLVDDVAWAVAAAGRTLGGKNTCLLQAICAERMLRRRGLLPVLRIGVGRDDASKVVAHAWLEWGGRVLVGGEEMNRFTPLQPPPRAG